ncbi:ABC transporter substrate-binding protein [Corynebacterium minutissimum]
MRYSLGAGLLAVAVTASACGEGRDAALDDVPPTPSFGLLTDVRLASTNAATPWGDAMGASQLASRIYPAMYVPGPAGQMIPNSDLIHAEYYPSDAEHPGAHVDFKITDQAKFSDDVPVTCDDYLLSYTAGLLNQTFGSRLPLVGDIAAMECAPESKEFTVWFNPDSGSRWRYLFGPGTVLPTHAIAQRSQMSVEELNAALHAQDPSMLEQVAQTWRDGFSTEPGHFDRELQVSFGPYVIDRVEDSGAVVLKANDSYYGDKPELEEVVVWPDTADATALLESDELRVAESHLKEPSWLDRNAEGNPFDVTPVVGTLTDTFSFSDAGLFSQPWARQAFAACVDTERLADAASRQSGVEVPAVHVRTVPHDDPVAAQMASISRVPIEPAVAGGLAGTTIGVGYLAPNPRYEAMLEELRAVCEPSGITIEDRSGDRVTRADLAADPTTGLPGIDVYLGPVDPLREYSAPTSSVKNSRALRELEQQLWEELPSIPVSAQPRSFIVDRAVSGVVPYTGPAGIGWNLDRWSDTRNQETEAKEES